MNVLGWLRDTPAGDGLFRECRHCGTNVDTAGAGCPACGSFEIAIYEV